MTEKKTLILRMAIGALLFSLGGITGWIIEAKESSQAVTTFNAVEQASPSYKFIDPLLFIQNPESGSFPQYTPLKDAINAYASSAISQGKATAISVYFRDLNQNKWIGINSDLKFSPASMLKVFTAIAVLHAAESDPSFLPKEITVPPVPSNILEQDYYPPNNPIEVGKTYTVETLLEHLIEESDNVANYTLINLLNPDELEGSYSNFKLPTPNASISDAITSQEYSRLFRILYSGTYLTHDSSEKALALLSQTQFTEGLVAGVPAGTLVSHKFGERSFGTTTPSSTTSPSGTESPHELHDCGIIYYPHHPYFLCVMTKGSDFASLASILSTISNIAWNNMETLYGTK